MYIWTGSIWNMYLQNMLKLTLTSKLKACVSVFTDGYRLCQVEEKYLRDCLKTHCTSSFLRPYSAAFVFLETVCLPLGAELFALTVFYINYISTPPWPLLGKQLGMLQKPNASHKLTERGRKVKSTDNTPYFSACPYPQILILDVSLEFHSTTSWSKVIS